MWGMAEEQRLKAMQYASNANDWEPWGQLAEECDARPASVDPRYLRPLFSVVEEKELTTPKHHLPGLLCECLCQIFSVHTKLMNFTIVVGATKSGRLCRPGRVTALRSQGMVVPSLAHRTGVLSDFQVFNHSAFRRFADSCIQIAQIRLLFLPVQHWPFANLRDAHHNRTPPPHASFAFCLFYVAGVVFQRSYCTIGLRSSPLLL